MYQSLDEAVAAKLDLVSRIQMIDAQLAERGVTPYNTHEELLAYRQWKTRACVAKSHLVTKLQKTKIWINTKREEQALERLAKRGGPDALLHDLYSVTKRLVSGGAGLTNDQQRLLDDVRSYLERNT